MLGCTEVSLMLYWSIPYGMLSFPFLVWVRMTFACIIPAMFLSEFELAPNIVITSLFYLNILSLPSGDEVLGIEY